jgi:hypothetical protein
MHVHIDAQEAVLWFRNGSVRSGPLLHQVRLPRDIPIRYVDTGGYTCFGYFGED